MSEENRRGVLVDVKKSDPLTSNKRGVAFVSVNPGLGGGVF